MTTGARDIERVSPWLHAAVVVVSAATVVIVALGSTRPTSVPIGITVGCFVIAWVAFGRRTLNGGPGWRWFLAIAAATMFVGALIDPNFAAFQTIVYPLVWLISPDVRRAVPANLAMGIATGVGYALSTRSVVESLVMQAASLAFSFGLGIWISRITCESEERKRLLDTLTATQHQLAAVNRENGVAAERERLARELHDTIAQSLTGIVMLAERAKARHPDDTGLTVLEEAAREALTETRGLVAATAPVTLDGGLAGAVELLGRRFERETGVRITTEVRAAVPRSLEVVLLRCAQEGLANVRKHAGASAADIRISGHDGAVTLTVTDDGAGFQDAAVGDGFGLSGMRDRVALVGGSVALGHTPSGGARLEVHLPQDAATVTT